MQNADVVIRNNPSVINSAEWRKLLKFLFSTLNSEDLDSCAEHGFTVECSDLHALIEVLVQGWYRVTDTDTDTVPPLMITVEPVIGQDTRWSHGRIALAPKARINKMREIADGIFVTPINDPEDIVKVLGAIFGERTSKK